MRFLYSPRAIGAMTRFQRQMRLRILMDRDKGCCRHCGRRVRVLKIREGERQPPDMATEDHALPKCDGGTDEISNLLLACFDCNNRRGRQSLETFAAAEQARRGLGR